MSAFGGPEIAESSVIFNIDAKDYRSYDGRENLLTYSEQMDNSLVWSPINATVTGGAAIAPDGTLTADLYKPNVAGVAGARRLMQNVTMTIGSIYTVSFYLKYSGVRYVVFGIYDDVNNNCGGGFDLVSGTVTGTGGVGTNYSASDASIQDVGGGWFRCSVRTNCGGTAASAVHFYNSSTAYTSGSIYLESYGDGTSGVCIWGAQLENGPDLGDYVKTLDSEVTRSNTAYNTANTTDVATLSSSVTYDVSNGTFALNGTNGYITLSTSYSTTDAPFTMGGWFNLTANTGNQMCLMGASGTGPTGGGLCFVYNPGYANAVYVLTYDASGNQVPAAVTSTKMVPGEWYNIVVTHDDTAVRIYVNANLEYTRASTGYTPWTVDPIRIGINRIYYPFYGEVSNAFLYNRALTDDEIRKNFIALRGRHGI